MSYLISKSGGAMSTARVKREALANYAVMAKDPVANKTIVLFSDQTSIGKHYLSILHRRFDYFFKPVAFYQSDLSDNNCQT